MLAAAANRAALGLAALIMAGTPVIARACEPVDFLTIALPKVVDPVATAIEVAYPGVKIEDDHVVFSADIRLPLGEVREIEPAKRLLDPSIREQFFYRYPLDFDLRPRSNAWVDPGRLRNTDFIRALYPGGKSDIARGLRTVIYPGLGVKPKFLASQRHCVYVQLQAALAEVAEIGVGMDRYFRRPGGSFAWRRIAGTQRYSAHSFGIAIDVDKTLGQYWRWSGAKPGKAGRYKNKIPEEMVRAFERRGFIWGGKWHHYDGMHFEYRPELILYSRIVGG